MTCQWQGLDDGRQWLRLDDMSVVGLDECQWLDDMSVVGVG